MTRFSPQVCTGLRGGKGGGDTVQFVAGARDQHEGGKIDVCWPPVIIV